MRPLQLTLSGLHSYRGSVTVDFEALGRFGLFGIFGKIGSGKSTLLDGITLALYGLVDRIATRSRKGLVNLAVDRCEVRFRFAVDNPGPRGGREVYEVHRAYREVDGVAQRTASRLVRLGGARAAGVAGAMAADDPLSARVVLAEKEAEVTAAVTEIVGLGAEDFMRAVVLPQGRFAQLLHLKGQERRQMLQRIFRLQAYGETLRKQVRDRQEGSRGTLAEIRGELLGLGDASAAAVRAAEGEAARAREARNLAERALAGIRDDHAVASSARDRTARVRAAERDLQEHVASEPEQTSRLERIAAALRVRPLLGPARRWRAAVGRLPEAQERAAKQRAAAEQSRGAERAAREAAAAAREAEQADGPRLRRMLVRLEQVEVWEHELDAEQVRASAATYESAAARTQLTEAEAAIAEGRAAAGRLEAERRRLKKEYTRHRVGAEEREVVLRASRAADRVQSARRRSEEAQQDEAAARTVCERRGAEVDRAEAAHRAAQEALDGVRAELHASELAPELVPEAERATLAGLVADHDRWRALHASHEQTVQTLTAEAAEAHTRRAQAEIDLERATEERSAAEQILRGAERALATAEATLERARSRAAAAELAQALTSGGPCPVCGSPHHPAPAQAPGELPQAAVEAHQAGREKAARRQETAIADHGRAVAALEAARATEATATERMAAAQRALTESTERLASGAAVQARLEAHQQALARVEAAREAVRRAVTEVDRVSVPLAVARAGAESARNDLERLVAVRAARATEEGEAWSAFDRERGPLTLLELGSALASLEARDRRAEAAEQALEQVEAQQQELEGRMATARAEAEAARSALERAQERLDGASARIASLEAQIRAEIGERATADLAAEARESLAALEARRASTEEAATEAARRREEAAREADQAEAAARAAEDEYAAATAALRELAEAAGLGPRAPSAHPGGAVALDPEGTGPDGEETGVEGSAGSGVEAAQEPSGVQTGCAPTSGDPTASADRADRGVGAEPWFTIGQVDGWVAACPDDPTLASWQEAARRWQERRVALEARVAALVDPAGTQALDDEAFATLTAKLEAATEQAESARDQAATATRRHEDLVARAGRHAELTSRGDILDQELARLDELAQLLRGDRFVEFVANDHLAELTARAATHLRDLTGGRYGLALDDELSFVIRDEDAGGALRPVHTLSGGESFLTALSLALALSTKVQERSARPLGFFFLDEGFGTLDPEAIDRVLTAIERLRDDSRLIGLISHVPAIRDRVPRYLWVHGDAATGSSLEMLDN